MPQFITRGLCGWWRHFSTTRRRYYNDVLYRLHNGNADVRAIHYYYYYCYSWAFFLHPRGNHFETKHMPRGRVTNNAIRSCLVYIFAPTLPPLITAAVFCHGNAVVPVHLFHETERKTGKREIGRERERQKERRKERRNEREPELEGWRVNETRREDVLTSRG